MKSLASKSIGFWAPFLLATLVACGGSKNADTRFTPNSESPNSNDRNVNCDDILFVTSENGVEKIKFPLIVEGGFVVAAGAFEQCESSQTNNGQKTALKRAGYSQIKVYLNYRIDGAGFLLPLGRPDDVIYSGYALQDDLTAETRTAIFNQLSRAALPKNLENTILTGSFLEPGFYQFESWLAFDQEPLQSVQFVAEERKPGQSFNTFRFRALIQSRDAVAAFNRGQTSAQIYHVGFLGRNFQSQSLNVKPGTQSLQMVPANRVALEVWTRNFRSSAFETLSAWFNRGFLVASDFAAPSGLATVADYAKTLWQQRSANPENPELNALKFLAAVEPTVVEYQKIINLTTQVGAIFSSELTSLKQALYLQSLGYSDAQNDYIIGLATSLMTSLYGAEAWNTALELSPLLQFKGEGRTLFTSMFEWYKSGSGPGVYSNSALQQSKELLCLGYSQVRFDLLKKLYSWLASSRGPGLMSSTALSKARSFADDSNFSPELERAVEGVYTWLASSGGPGLMSSSALAKTENWVLVSKLSPADIEVIKASYTWLTSSSGPGLMASSGLSKAEDYVETRHMTDAKLSALKARYTVLYKNMNSSSALAQAEREIL